MTMEKRITSPEELRKLREQAKADMDQRTGPKEIQITVHMGTCGIAAGARDILSHLAEQLTEANVSNVTLHQSGCLGLCDQEPMLTLADRSAKSFRYGRLSHEKVQKIVREHVLGGKPVMDYLLKT